MYTVQGWTKVGITILLYANPQSKGSTSNYKQNVFVVLPILRGFPNVFAKNVYDFRIQGNSSTILENLFMNFTWVRGSRVLLILVAWVGQNIQNTEECKEGERHKNLHGSIGRVTPLNIPHMLSTHIAILRTK